MNIKPNHFITVIKFFQSLYRFSQLKTGFIDTATNAKSEQNVNLFLNSEPTVCGLLHERKKSLLRLPALICFAVLMLLISINDCKAMPPDDDTSSSITLFPEGLAFLPLRGYAAEPKLGVLYYTASTNLKVDVGNSMEIIGVNLSDSASEMKIGIEFMAYAWSTSYRGYRLQISALDGFFGGHLAYKKRMGCFDNVMRFRYIHNSAHLVDGNFDQATMSWLNGNLPIPFTRDFAELTLAPNFYGTYINLRPYAGFSQSFRIRPDIIKRASYFAGLECHTANPAGHIFKQPVILFAAYHLQLNGVPKYESAHHVQAGVKFGYWEKKGINFYLSYFTGNNLFNEYYYQRISRFGIGFSVDFPG